MPSPPSTTTLPSRNSSLAVANTPSGAASGSELSAPSIRTNHSLPPSLVVSSYSPAFAIVTFSPSSSPRPQPRQKRPVAAPPGRPASSPFSVLPPSSPSPIPLTTTSSRTPAQKS